MESVFAYLADPPFGLAFQGLALPVPEAKVLCTPLGEEKWLGTAQDKIIAAKLGRTRWAVTQHRLLAAIPPKLRVYAHAWTAEQKSLLGKMPDAQVARRIGRSKNAVMMRRQMPKADKPNVNIERISDCTRKPKTAKSGFYNFESAGGLGRYGHRLVCGRRRQRQAGRDCRGRRRRRGWLSRSVVG